MVFELYYNVIMSIVVPFVGDIRWSILMWKNGYVAFWWFVISQLLLVYFRGHFYWCKYIKRWTPCNADPMKRAENKIIWRPFLDSWKGIYEVFYIYKYITLISKASVASIQTRIVHRSLPILEKDATSVPIYLARPGIYSINFRKEGLTLFKTK